MKSIIYEFDPVIYPFPVLVTKDFNTEEIKERYRTTNTQGEFIQITTELDTNGTVTARFLVLVDEFDKMYYTLLLYRPGSIGCGICTHESTHLANAYLQYLGFSPAQTYDDEAYAYLAQWVSNCMWSVLVDDPMGMKGVKVK